MTCPPLDISTLDTRDLVADVVYLRLHGLPEQPFLYGDNWTTAISAEQVAQGDFNRSLVFLEGCYGIYMSEAFLRAGALAVVGSAEITYGKRWFLGPSSKIGRRWLQNVRVGMTAGAALAEATKREKSAYKWRVAGNGKARLI